MEMKKLGHKKESDPQRRIEKFDKFAQKFNQNTCREFFFNYSDQKTLKSVVLWYFLNLSGNTLRLCYEIESFIKNTLQS